MTIEPKFCKDCKHFKLYEVVRTPFGTHLGGEANCEHPSLREEVFGSQLSIDAAKRRERQPWRRDMGCGEGAWQFEAGERTPGVLQASLDRRKEIIEKLRDRPAFIEQHIFPQPRPWWRFWK